MCYMMRRFINLCRSFSTLKSSKTTTSPSPIPQTTQKNTFHTSKMADFSSIKHRNLKVNGINMHIAERGEETAPIILFIHGFPELWYTWRHQIMGLSSLGYRAIAPDMRGYGETDAPTDSRSYSYGHIVGDLVGLIDELGVEKVFVVGHDWGAIVAWWLCLFRPDRVKALVNTSVPFSPRNPKYKPLDLLQATYGENYYISRFQEVGEIEKEISEAGGADVLLRKIFAYKSIAPFMLPKGQPLNKDLPPYPDWLSEQDAAYYSHKFTQTGFTGGLNYYRALNLNWEITAPWTGAQVKVPVKFIVGDLDLTYGSPMVKDYIHKGGMKKDVPLLNDVVILDGVGHFLQEEVPQLITNHIYDFFHKF